MSVLFGIICSMRWCIYLHSCLMRLVSVCYCVYRIFVVYVMYGVSDCMFKGVRPRPLTWGKGGELKRINHE